MEDGGCTSLVGAEIHGFHTLQDDYNWKKKKDGKTIKKAHEHLKVGDKERIHVYYAHGEDNSTFVRRCYWLLDKSLEKIVLVHYRETKEVSLATHSNSSLLTDQSTHLLFTEEFDSRIANTYSEELGENVNVRNHEMKLLEINTLEWHELLVANGANDSITSRGGIVLVSSISSNTYLVAELLTYFGCDSRQCFLL
ncbi:hypothetical protein ES288_D12G091100v1 [Gossypium darwinii]|uniref:CG-1 domain-containing protein n=1 Tax=Gossypium darwinii TaxID=34276 RepID=A0A5D2A8I4_GOSDA|nr:hypothetical protein ES288_D12G091100v1 [Gossypium darwinii]